MKTTGPVGPCGDVCPSIAGGPRITCTLDAGHRGIHVSGTASWTGPVDQPAPAPDAVHHPAHYAASLPATCKQGHPVECIDVVQHLNFCRGNVVKYVWRAGAKGSELEDLRKARQYLDFEIARIERLDVQP